MKQQFSGINTLVLISSCECNLSCDYCIINKSKNKYSQEIAQKTKQAFQDGTFLQNTLTVLNNYNTSPFEITHCEFWGQEPTLSLHYFTEHLNDWLDNFPNLRYFMFSTNGVAYSNRIVDFIKTLDNSIGHETQIVIQFSYDGEESNKDCRKVSSSNITSSVTNVITELNKINLKNVKVNLNFHNVIPLVLIKTIKTMNQANEYLINLKNWGEQFSKLNINKNVMVENRVIPSFESPLKASVEDGLDLLHFYQLIEKCDFNKSNNYIFSNDIIGSMKRWSQDIFNQCDQINQTPLESLLNIEHDFYFFRDKIKKIFQIGHCGAYTAALKVRYDGIVMTCQNQMYDTEISEDDFNKDKFSYSIKKKLNSSNRILNFTVANKENMDNLYYFHSNLKESFFTIYNNTLNLMYIMARAGQINYDYILNKEKLMFHAFLITTYNACPYNRMFTSGSISLIHDGHIRLFCNGFLDEIFDYSTGKFLFKTELRG